MQLSELHIVPNLEKPIRFQEYAVGIFKTIPTKSGIKKAVKKEIIFIDDILATTSKYIVGGEKIELYQLTTENTFKRLKLDIEVLFEDDHLAIVYKPAGVLVSGNKFVTIANALTQNLTKSSKANAVKPQPIHRLDYPTSGVLLVGKTSTAILELSNLFKNKKITKTYFAVTVGKMNPKGNINLKIDHKEAITDYEVQESVPSNRFNFLNLVKLLPKTGRKHQLRIHLSSIKNQILGDKEHGDESLMLNGKGLYLHEYSLKFIHPFTKETVFVSKQLPKKFTKIFSNTPHLKTTSL